MSPTASSPKTISPSPPEKRLKNIKMEPGYLQFGAAFGELFPSTAAVCPNVPAVSEWAREKLNFQPSPKQAEVLDGNARYLLLCCNRQWGKTTTIAIKALHHAVHQERQTIVILSRTRIQAGILLERARDFATALGLKFRRVLGREFSLKLENGSQIFAIAHNQDTCLGNSANVLIVDEAALVKDAVFFTVSPYISRTHGSIWILSTPRRQAGFFYNFWHDNDPRWHRVLSTVEDCPEIDREFLAMQRTIDETRYRQDFLCEFVKPDDCLIDRETIERMRDPNIPQWHL
jgi:hypothetical protein